jgi:hypothetical protein
MSEYYNKAQMDAIAAIIGNRITQETDPATLKTQIDALADTGFITDAERSKLSGLESSKYRGLFASVGALPGTGSAGDYADVDTGVGNDVQRYIWDDDDNAWVAQGSGGTLTAAQIKTEYESNADTNAFTDAEKSKLAALTEAANINDFTAALDGAIT